MKRNDIIRDGVTSKCYGQGFAKSTQVNKEAQRNMADKPDVIAIHRDLELAHFDDGTTMPITDWYDDSGDECEIEDATFATARYRDKYVSINLNHFPKGYEL